jgi:UDP-GlcNAc:undecaprenyl-phosphate/decaprenyl-phosphate GlcNAc-1-phosphate transferase
MAPIMLSIGIAFLITLLFMFALPPVARTIGLIDRPGGRKMHIGEIPVTGGLAMAAGLLFTSPFLLSAVPGYPFFLTALAILVLIGALDDRFDLPASVRALAQCCAVLIMAFGANVLVADIGYAFFDGLAGLGWFSELFTILIVLTAINAFNMFDGSDGVAGIQALIGLIFLGTAAAIVGTPHYLPLIASLLGCVLAFLVFNWPSQRTRGLRAFMGDAGSTMLGFSLAWLSVGLSQGETRALAPIAVLWIFALPLFDFFSSMVRRILDGRSPFHGDSDHLHHVLRRSGHSSRRVALIILLTGTFLAAVGVGAYFAGIPDGTMFVAWLATGVAYHVIFGSGLFVRRRMVLRDAQPQPLTTPALEDTATTSGVYPTLWRQRKRG